MACGKNFKTYLVGSFSALGGFLFGYHTGVISGILPMDDFKYMICNKSSLRDCISIYNEDSNYLIGLIVGILLFGCFIGSLIGGQTGDRFSRKYSICVFSIIFTIGAAIQTASINLAMILLGRFLAGISIGALSMMVPLYHSEIADTEVRGRVTTLQQFAVTLGIAISFWVNFIILMSKEKIFGQSLPTWKIPLGLQMIPSIILSIGILFCPFSPRWLVSRDREEEASEVLMKIRSATYEEIKDEIDRIKIELADLRENEIESYRQLIQFPLLRPFLLGIGIHILQQISGINAILYYAPYLFNKSSTHKYFNLTPEEIALTMTGTVGTVNFLFTIPTIISIDKLGRRTLLIIGATTMSIAFLIVTIFTKNNDSNNTWITIVFLHIFVAGFAFSWGPIPCIYCTEIFPLTMRAKATSIALAVNWGVDCLVSFIVPLVILKHTYETFLTFCIICAFMIIIIYLFYPETKSKHLEDRNIVESGQVFIPDWLELKRRRNYNTFPNETTPINRSTDNVNN